MLKIEKFRRIQTIVSSSLFVVIFFFFLFSSEYNILDIQLSYWGAFDKLKWLWNGLLILLSISIYFNASQYLNLHKNLKFKKLINIGFIFLCAMLFLTGLFNLNYRIHTVSAYIYFFTFPLLIFSISHFNSRTLPYREWLWNLILACAMLILPLIFLKIFKGMAISETIHSFLAITWNIWILTKTKES